MINGNTPLSWENKKEVQNHTFAASRSEIERAYEEEKCEIPCRSCKAVAPKLDARGNTIDHLLARWCVSLAILPASQEIPLPNNHPEHYEKWVRTFTKHLCVQIITCDSCESLENYPCFLEQNSLFCIYLAIYCLVGRHCTVLPTVLQRNKGIESWWMMTLWDLLDRTL